VIDACVAALEPLIGIGPACRAAGKSKATHYRHQQPPKPRTPRAPRAAANALGPEEVAAVLKELRSERFCDLAPAQVWATLLDEDCYLCSISTMYRILRATGEVRDRRSQAGCVKPDWPHRAHLIWPHPGSIGHCAPGLAVGSACEETDCPGHEVRRHDGRPLV
jgi:hypothetical protein